MISWRPAQGVWEKDEIRKDDSFTTFEEIFDHAKRYDVRQQGYISPLLRCLTANLDAVLCHAFLQI